MTDAFLLKFFFNKKKNYAATPQNMVLAKMFQIKRKASKVK